MSDQPGIVVPGRPNNSGNPLTALKDGMQAQTDVLVEGFNTLAKAIAGQQPHRYALESAHDPNGNLGFRTYCQACSEEQMAYVYPCARVSSEELPQPPEFFTMTPPATPADPSTQA